MARALGHQYGALGPLGVLGQDHDDRGQRPHRRHDHAATDERLLGGRDLLWSRVIKEFPDVRFALSEGGTGWIPYFVDRLDRTYEMHHLWTGQDFGDRLPSEVFRERFLTCFIADPIGVKLRHDVGIDNIAWECDYPHSDSSWPTAAEELALVMAGLPDDEVNKITYENACRWYSFDPFEHRTRQQCTVGALRAAVGDHNVEIRSFDHGRFERTGGATLGSVSAKLDV